MLKLAATYGATLVTFLVIDFIWIRTVMVRLFREDVPHLLAEQTNYAVAAGFYVLFAAALVYFAVWPSRMGASFGKVAFDGAFIGLIAYGAYEATNMATLQGWTWRLFVVDIAWGIAIGAISALAGYAALKAVSS